MSATGSKTRQTPSVTFSASDPHSQKTPGTENNVPTTIPVPIKFSLPEGWRSVDPDEVNAGQAAFVAVLPPGSKGFTPNITISGELRNASVPLTRLADDAVERLRRGAPDAELGKRKETDGGRGLTQAVRMTLELNGRREQLVQLQVFLGMRDTSNAERYAVLEIVLSALAEQYPDVVGDFQQFLSTIVPDEEK